MFPIDSTVHFDRRKFLTGTSAWLSLAALSSQRTFGAPLAPGRFSAYPFTLGVASGDPDGNGFVIWTRLAPSPFAPDGGLAPEPIEVEWVVAEDEALSKVVQKGVHIATPQWGHSVHVEVQGLRPDRWYWYQFRAGAEASPAGRSRTFPLADASPRELRFAVASCQHYEYGYYTAYEHMAQEDLDLVVFLGDYIYEYKGADNHLRKHLGDEIMTLGDYRVRYAQYRSDPALSHMHAQVPWLVTWDDHEVDNNYAGDISELNGVAPADFLVRRAAAYQAYYEHMPLRAACLPKGPDMQLFRRVPFGQLADFHILDTRQYRTDQPLNDGHRPFDPAQLDPVGTLMGPAQRDWLFRGLKESPAQWNILAQQIMMGHVDRKAGPEQAFEMDQWPGYEFERRNLIRYFRDAQIRNPVVLTGDIHTNWANELVLDFEQPEQGSAAVEFVGTSISSGGDGQLEPKSLQDTYRENPFVKFHSAERGYLSCTVTPGLWETNYQAVPFVSKPGAPLLTRASFVVESGRPHLVKA
jgi:alkaline phosphatase D